MISIWTDTVEMPCFPSLKQDIHTDVLVIGGGMSGILCAHMLKQAGISCVVVEANRICGGVTSNTTAKITSQHGLIYSKLLREFGKKTARMYYEANENALMQYRKMAKMLPCGFREQDAYVYASEETTELDKEWHALQEIGVTADYVKGISLPHNVAGAIRFLRQAQFHPLKFAAGLVSDLEIYERTPIRTYDGTSFLTDHGKITAKKTIVATHFPFLNKHGAYFLKMYQYRSYVIALEHAGDVHGMYVDGKQGGLSFRNAEGLLLIGGGGHRTGKQGGNWEEISAYVQQYYPDAKEQYRWATQDCMTLDGVPYIGPYSRTTPNLYVATGFNKWGMTSSMAAALLLRDLILEKGNPYAELFSPMRTIFRPQLAVNAAEAVVNLLAPTKPRCPHMGCALKWNRAEQTWDCPCHGSRFSQTGSVLNSPATDDLKYSGK